MDNRILQTRPVAPAARRGCPSALAPNATSTQPAHHRAVLHAPGPARAAAALRSRPPLPRGPGVCIALAWRGLPLAAQAQAACAPSACATEPLRCASQPALQETIPHTVRRPTAGVRHAATASAGQTDIRRHHRRQCRTAPGRHRDPRRPAATTTWPTTPPRRGQRAHQPRRQQSTKARPWICGWMPSKATSPTRATACWPPRAMARPNRVRFHRPRPLRWCTAPPTPPASAITKPAGAPTGCCAPTRIRIDHAEDVGVAQGGVLEFKGVPVLPMPHISFPLSDKRKSGLLPPTIGLDSRRRAGIHASPITGTLPPTATPPSPPALMTKRGVNLGGEFRYLEPDVPAASSTPTSCPATACATANAGPWPPSTRAH